MTLPRLQPLRIPAGWLVQWNELREVEPSEETAGFFGGSSMFSAVHPQMRFWIDVEWRPEFDPTGAFRMRVEYAPWGRDERGRRTKAPPRFADSEVVREFETRSLGELVDELDRWLLRCASWVKEGH